VDVRSDSLSTYGDTRMKRANAWVIAPMILLCRCQHDVSGTYIASDKGAVASIQLVRTPDNHLTGQFTVAGLKSDGTIDRKSSSLTGAVDSENVSITSAGFLGIQSTTLSRSVERRHAHSDRRTNSTPYLQQVVSQRLPDSDERTGCLFPIRPNSESRRTLTSKRRTNTMKLRASG
jgi:hypothetical protein